MRKKSERYGNSAGNNLVRARRNNDFTVCVESQTAAWSQAREAARLVEHGDARLYPADGPKVGYPEEDVVAYLSTHIFLDSQGRW